MKLAVAVVIKLGATGRGGGDHCVEITGVSPNDGVATDGDSGVEDDGLVIVSWR